MVDAKLIITVTLTPPKGTVVENFFNWWSDLSSLRLVEDHDLCPILDCKLGQGSRLGLWLGLRLRIESQG